MSQKLRAAIIGIGNIARSHAHGYLASKRFEIVALADVHEPAMERFESEHGLSSRHYLDARKMLDEEELDAVSICLWTGLHAEMTIAAAARKPRAILCEKPMAIDLGECERMLVACQRNDVKLVIGHQRRFLPAYTRARELIAEGAIGQVELITSIGHDGLPNYCSHQTDMYRYLLGDDECVWAMGNVERKTDRYERGTRIEDRAIANFEFRGGARATIYADLSPEVYQGAKIYGSDGIIQLTTTYLRLLSGSRGHGWEHEEPEGRFHTLAKAGKRFEWREAPAGQADELADWIEGKREDHRNRGENGYKALEMLMAVYESARCHERVDLPLQTRVNPLDLMIDNGELPIERPGRYDIRARFLHGEDMTGG